jgi:hypothetical protein
MSRKRRESFNAKRVEFHRTKEQWAYFTKKSGQEIFNLIIFCKVAGGEANPGSLHIFRLFSHFLPLYLRDTIFYFKLILILLLQQSSYIGKLNGGDIVD